MAVVARFLKHFFIQQIVFKVFKRMLKHAVLVNNHVYLYTSSGTGMCQQDT